MACSELVTIVDCHIVVSYSPDMTSSGPYYFRVKAFNTDDTYLSSMWFISWLIGIPFRSYQGLDLVISTALQGSYFSLCSHKSGRINRNNYQSINRQKNNNVFHTHLRNSMMLLMMLKFLNVFIIRDCNAQFLSYIIVDLVI